MLTLGIKDRPLVQPYQASGVSKSLDWPSVANSARTATAISGEHVNNDFSTVDSPSKVTNTIKVTTGKVCYRAI